LPDPCHYSPHVSDGETKGQSAPADRPAEPPSQRISANMLVGYNMAYFRKAAGMTQEELGQRLGWTNVAVSAAERSWDGKRVRQFDADVIADLAMTLGVPVPALFLPPEDDGERERYVMHADDFPDDPISMGRLLSYVIPEPPLGGDPALRAYEERLIAAMDFYFPSASEDLGARLRQRATDEQVLKALQEAREHRAQVEQAGDAIESMVADNALLQGVLIAALNASPEEKVRISAQETVPPERRSWQMELVKIGRELFGPQGPVTTAEVERVIEKAHRSGVTSPGNAAYVRVLADGTYRLVKPKDTRSDQP
jgi:transcriptional regulator with XRE-family HTH domain